MSYLGRLSALDVLAVKNESGLADLLSDMEHQLECAFIVDGWVGAMHER